jgi:hypothetical protein
MGSTSVLSEKSRRYAAKTSADVIGHHDHCRESTRSTADSNVVFRRKMHHTVDRHRAGNANSEIMGRAGPKFLRRFFTSTRRALDG